MDERTLGEPCWIIFSGGSYSPNRWANIEWFVFCLGNLYTHNDLHIWNMDRWLKLEKALPLQLRTSLASITRDLKKPRRPSKWLQSTKSKRSNARLPLGSLGKVQGGYWTLHGHGFLYTYIIYTYNCVEQIYLIVGISIPYYTYLIISIDHTHNYMIIYYIYMYIYYVIICV